MSENAVKLFKRKLTNLSSANPQLWITRLKADFHFDCKALELAQIFDSHVFLDQLLSGKKEIILCPLIDPRDNSVNQLAQKLGNISRKQKLIFQERGVDELYVSFPFVTGQWPDGSWVRTPFLLIPVKLERDLKHWRIYPNLNDAFINPSFLLAYAFHFKVALEQKFYDREIDFSGTDAVSFLTSFYHVLKESKIEILFNQDLFLKQIVDVHPIVKENLPSGFRPGILKLEPFCVLGIFPLSDSVLVPDFDYIEEKELTLEDIFLKLVDGPSEISEKNLLCPLPIDGSQEDAIKNVKSGQSLVIQGPPGTGKSQLIANLIADAMGAGRSVLLVCQKRIALEVVQKRLTEVGLGKFIGLWSDYKKDREPVYRQIQDCIEELSETETKNSTLDTLLLERNFNKVCSNIDQISQRLEIWKEALYETESAGISIKELYGFNKEKSDYTFESNHFIKFRHEDWNHFLAWLSTHWEEIKFLYKSDFVFKNRKNWFLKGDDFFSAIPEKWKKISEKLQTLDKAHKKICKIGERDKEFSILQKRKVLIFAILNVDNQLAQTYDYLFHNFNKFISTPELLNNAIEQWGKVYSICQNQGFWPFGLEIRISEIDSLLKNIDKYEKYFHVSLLKPFAIFLHKKIAGIAKFEPYFPNKKTWLTDLKMTLQNSLLLAEISQHFLRTEISNISESQFNELVYRHEKFLIDLSDLKIYQNAFFRISKFMQNENLRQYTDFQNAIQKLGKQTLQLETLLEDWNSDFTKDNSVFLLTEFSKSDQFIDLFLKNRDAIWKIDQQELTIPDHWKSMAQEVANWPWKRQELDFILAELKPSWIKNWIEMLERKHPFLGSVDKQSWHSDLKILRDSIQEKRKIVSSILDLRLSEKSYKELEINRLGNRVSYRNLYHQVSKKRLRAPLRKLWSDHEEEIKRIIPAWLATPESVSATWPITTKFDLVIFDESSQCFAERGIPSAFRARQIVIVGDSKQLPPNQLFSARWEENENEEDAVFFEQNSLLDLAQQFLPQVMLKGHYRSSFPELISFSNQYFYKNQLEFLPDASALLSRKPALLWRKIDGTWKDQQNLEEAKEIANSLFAFIDAHPLETLGIITFNAKQQILVEREIERQSLENERIIPEWLFVKNIENVQGDERDHIWFSIAYAKNEQQRVVAQFGTLSQIGGENRLNVAITRARKSITVFSSILPGELPTNDNSPEGPKLLKRYLEFVYKIGNQTDIDHFINSNNVKIGMPIMVESEAQWILDDGAALYNSTSMKDYLGYKFLTLSGKGYEVKYEFSGK